MKFATTAIAAMAATLAVAVDPIEVKGSAFYKKGSSDRFYIRGVDYQPGGSSKLSDPLADKDGCKRDVEYFKELGINTIRVYTVFNDQDHDDCMKMLDDAGIYVIVDTSTPKNSINRADPKPSYNAAFLQTVFATIDTFKDYDNVLGFFAANEVINSPNTTATAPYIKAVARDMKAYIKSQAKRKIPVGYSAADVSDNRWEQMQYLNCGDDADSRVDMFGMNDYSWCGDSSFEKSGYQSKVNQYKDYGIPIFLSEFGCNEVTPRKFTEIETIYSDKMGVFSGGLVYEYTEEGSKYGLVKLDGDKVTKLDDFDTLKKQFANVKDPKGSNGAKDSSDASTCPKYEENLWEVKDNKVPTMPSDAKKYIESGAGKPLGTGAPWTQNGADDSPDAGGGSSKSEADTSSGSSSSGSSSGSSGATSSGAANAVAVPQVFSSMVVVPAVMLGASFLFGCSML